MGKSHHSEEYYLDGIKQGNEAALGSLYINYFPMVSRFIFNNSGTDQEAKDIYQEAIILFYEQVKAGNLVLSCTIKTYIYSICRRLWLKRLSEKNRYTGKLDDYEEFIEVEQDVQNAEEEMRQHSIMKSSLGKLGEPCKTILEDYYIQGLSMDLITEKFGYTNSDNTKNQKYKCLQRLRKFFFFDYKEGVI